MGEVTGQIEWAGSNTTGVLTPSQFGPIDTTGVIACDVVLNLAIQAATANKQRLILPSGLLKLNAPLIIPRAGGVNQTFQMYGQGGSANPTDSLTPQYPLHPYDANTVLYTNYTNAPAIVLDSGRNVVLKDFAILGQNVAPFTAANLATGPSIAQSAYITAGCKTGRYAPYCGICFDPFSNTVARVITGISKAASAVVTVSTLTTQPFTVGQTIVFASVVGMVEINGLTGLITAVGGSSGAFTATVNINSTAFTTYASGGTAVGLPFSSATITGITQTASAVVTLSTSGGLIQQFQIGQSIYFSGVVGMVEINGLTGTVTALTMAYSNACTITVNINSSAFTAYSSAGLATASDYYAPLATSYLPISFGDATYGCVVENVCIQCFSVGIAVGCSGVTALSADLTFRNVNILYTDVCYAVGQSQGRNNNIEYGNMVYARTVIDGLNYGVGQGTPIMVIHSNIGFVYRIIALNPAVGSCVLNSIYTESIVSIGQYGFGGSSEAMPLLIVGGDYSFGGGGQSWLYNSIMLETYGPTTVVGVSFAYSTETDIFNVISPKSAVVFERCRFGGSSTANTAPQIGMSLSTAGGYSKLTDCWVNGGIYGGTSFNMSNELGRAPSVAFSQSGGAAGRLNASYQTKKVWVGANEYSYVPFASSVPEIGIGNCNSLTVNATTVTFNNNVGGNALYLQIGDILLWTMLPQGYSLNKYTYPALKITAIAGQAVTATMLFDPASYDTVANQGGGASQVFLAPNHWAPTVPLYCTASGITLSNVVPTTILQNGDYLSGVGIGLNTRVVSGGGTATVTVSVGATASVVIPTVACAGAAGQFTCASGAPAVGQFVLVSGVNSGSVVFTPAYVNPTYYQVTASAGGTSFTLAQQNGTALVTSGTTTTGLTFTIASNLWFGRLYAPALTAAF